MKKRIVLILILLTSVTLLSGFFTRPRQNTFTQVELLYETLDFEEVNRLSTMSELTLLNYDGRIAEFYYQGYGVDTYLEDGFVYNGLYQTQNPPFVNPIVNDPYYSNQYAIPLTNIDEAWKITTGSTSITVAIIDTGIDTDHPEFVGRLSALSYNAAYDQIGLEYVEDDEGHGTMVAGVIGANSNNNIGVAGVTNHVQLMVIKANENNVDTFKDSHIIRGIYYAVDNGADIINLSLGSTYANPLTLKAVTYAEDNNVIVVASSGNDGEEIKIYPASFDSVISVGSVDRYSTLSSFSNFNDKVDVVAPGSSITTTNMANSYSTVGGTSFSAPYVAGIIALYKSIYPESSTTQVKSALQTTSKDLGSTGYDIHYGDGLIDALALVSTNYIQVAIDYPLDYESTLYYVTSGSSITIEKPPLIENYEFMGFFMDELYQIPYTPNTTFTTNTTIYAYYRQTHAVITWVIDNQIIKTDVLAIGVEATAPETSLPGVIFFGWYTDDTFTDETTEFSVTENKTYYGYYVVHYYELQYIDEDKTTLLTTVQYTRMDPIVWMVGPEKPSDTYFDYTFIGWTEVELYNEDIVMVYPIYQKTLKPTLAGLNPGVDTLYEDETYTDTGVYVLIDGMEVRVVGSINTQTPSIQTLTYELYYEEELVYTLIRKVRVLTDNRLIVTLNKAITTLFVGDDYIEKGVTKNKGDVVITGTVDTEIPGIYKITYTVTYKTQTVIKSRYVIVFENIDPIPEAYLPNIKEDLYEI